MTSSKLVVSNRNCNERTINLNSSDDASSLDSSQSSSECEDDEVLLELEDLLMYALENNMQAAVTGGNDTELS